MDKTGLEIVKEEGLQNPFNLIIEKDGEANPEVKLINEYSLSKIALILDKAGVDILSTDITGFIRSHQNAIRASTEHGARLNGHAENIMKESLEDMFYTSELDDLYRSACYKMKDHTIISIGVLYDTYRLGHNHSASVLKSIFGFDMVPADTLNNSISSPKP